MCPSPKGTHTCLRADTLSPHTDCCRDPQASSASLGGLTSQWACSCAPPPTAYRPPSAAGYHALSIAATWIRSPPGPGGCNRRAEAVPCRPGSACTCSSRSAPPPEAGVGTRLDAGMGRSRPAAVPASLPVPPWCQHKRRRLVSGGSRRRPRPTAAAAGRAPGARPAVRGQLLHPCRP